MSNRSKYIPRREYYGRIVRDFAQRSTCKILGHSKRTIRKMDMHGPVCARCWEPVKENDGSS